MKRKPPSPKSVWVARYESANFLFEVFDSNPDRALDALHAGLRLHARQVGLAVEDWWNEECVELRQFAFGVFHRDGERVCAKGGAA